LQCHADRTPKMPGGICLLDYFELGRQRNRLRLTEA
jgi:hypothetical protein